MTWKTIWAAIQGVIAGIGAWLGSFLGGFDGLLYAALVFTIADYITGVLAAINEKRLSSSVGFRGISRKILIFTLIGLAHLLDVYVLGNPGVLRTATVFFYLSNEGISLLENAARLGLPIPGQIREALDAIGRKADTNKPPLAETTDDETNGDTNDEAGDGDAPDSGGELVPDLSEIEPTKHTIPRRAITDAEA